jgi:hypothetical protein
VVEDCLLKDEAKNNFRTKMTSEAGRAMPTKMPQFLDRVIDALRANDAVELRLLAERASEIRPPASKEERLAAQAKQRLLASALQRTGRNLRLLRRVLGVGSFENGRELYRRMES